jgi:hypothetical protein
MGTQCSGTAQVYPPSILGQFTDDHQQHPREYGGAVGLSQSKLRFAQQPSIQHVEVHIGTWAPLSVAPVQNEMGCGVAARFTHNHASSTDDLFYHL